MTAHPQIQPMPGTARVIQPAPGTAPAAQPTSATAPVTPAVQSTVKEASPKAKGASRNARIILGLSLLVATAGVSFAAGHVTAEGTASTITSDFAAGSMPFAAADGIEVAATTDASSSGGDPGSAGGPGMAAAAAVETGSEAEVSAISIEVEDAAQATAARSAPAQAAPADAPEGGMGGRPDMGGMPGGADGTVAEITDSSLTITAADGTEQAFTIDGTTSWLQQEAIDASVVELGDSVTVETAFGPGATETDSTVATQVVVATTRV